MRDGGNVVVLETLLAALLVVGLVGWLVAAGPASTAPAPSADAEAQPADVLAILGGTPTAAPHRSRLHEFVTQALAGENSNLSAAVDRLVGPGVPWSMDLLNGQGARNLAARGPEVGASSTSSVLLDPVWSYALVRATLAHQPGTESSDVDFEVVAVENSFLDRDATGRLVFENGHTVNLRARKDGILVADGVPPKRVGLAGFAVPYDTSGLTAYSLSVTAASNAPPVPYGVTTTLPYRTRATVVYTVHPNQVADPAIKEFLRAEPKVKPPSSAAVHPGDVLTVKYDYDGLPLASGWTVASREILLRSPVRGDVIAQAALPSLEGTWTWPVPRDAVYGTYVAEIRIGLISGTMEQKIHGVTAVDVAPPGLPTGLSPLYRVALTVWRPAG